MVLLVRARLGLDVHLQHMTHYLKHPLVTHRTAEVPIS
jgi:hypothetical protein